MDEFCQVCRVGRATMTLRRVYPISDSGPSQMTRQLEVDLCIGCETQFAEAFERVSNAIKARQEFKVVKND